jgi:hypothetical protein
MGSDLEHMVNEVAYRRMRAELDAKYPKGHFIGIWHGKVVADAPRLDGLIERVRGQGLDPLEVLAVRAGDDTPEYGIILPLHYDRDGA